MGDDGHRDGRGDGWNCFLSSTSLSTPVDIFISTGTCSYLRANIKPGRATTKQFKVSIELDKASATEVGMQCISFISISCLLAHLMFLGSINFVDNRMAVSVYPDRHVWSSLRQEGMMEIVNSESPGQTFIEFAVS